MPALAISGTWDDGTSVGVRCYEVVNAQGESVTLVYEATATKAGRTAAQVKSALVAAIKIQRDARLATLRLAQDVDLGGPTLTVT
jgi:hypothetical protein